MNKFKAIIADDEEQLRIYLKKGLNKFWPELEICGEAANGPDSVSLINEYKPHIAFLDIKMPGFSGIEVAEKCQGKCHMVFITAFNQYAVEAFENEAIDYILKPVTDERLSKTIDRLKRRLHKNDYIHDNISGAMEKLMSHIKSSEKKEYLQIIKAQHGTGIKLIPVSDIYFFKAEDKYTIVKTLTGESLIKKPIKQLEEELDPDKFWRIHRTSIINISRINKVEKSFTNQYLVKMNDINEFLTVSRSYSNLFRQM